MPSYSITSSLCSNHQSLGRLHFLRSRQRHPHANYLGLLTPDKENINLVFIIIGKILLLCLSEFVSCLKNGQPSILCFYNLFPMHCSLIPSLLKPHLNPVEPTSPLFLFDINLNSNFEFLFGHCFWSFFILNPCR